MVARQSRSDASDTRTLLPWQADFVGAVALDGEPLHAIRGGLGSGKSWLLCATADMLCETRPGASVVLGMDTFSRLERVHLPILRALAPRAEWAASSKTYRYGNGSVLTLVHVDHAPGTTSPIEGHNAHAVLLDECQALRPDALDVATSRARIARTDAAGIVRQPLVVTCGIPVEPAWWMERTREAGGRVWLPQTADNAVHLGASYMQRMRDTLSERDYKALVENRPLPPVGQVLYAFDPQTHPDGSIAPPGWRLDTAKMRTALTVDFGLRRPAALLLAEDLTLGAWVVCREWMPDDCSTPELARMLARDLAGMRLDLLYADPAGQARNAQTRLSELDVMGLPAPEGLGRRPVVTTSPERRDILAGCTRLNLALERRRLLIAPDLHAAGLRAPSGKRTLARALSGYRLDERTGEPAKDGTHDHAIDALRYFAQHQLWQATPVDGRLRVGTELPASPKKAAALMRGTGRWQR